MTFIENMSEGVLQFIGVVICNGLGLLSAFIANTGDLTWYNSLNQPPFRPPSKLFAFVWTPVHALIGIGLGSIVKSGEMIPLYLFISQFAMNLLWTPLFFKWQKISQSFYLIMGLWVNILALIFACFMPEISVNIFGFTFPVSILFAPYLTWVTFASVLNGSYWALNPNIA